MRASDLRIREPRRGPNIRVCRVETRLDRCLEPPSNHRDESRRGTHECLRHIAANAFSSTSGIRWFQTLAGVLLLALVAGAQVNQPARPATGDTGSPTDRFLHNRPFTLQEISLAIQSVAPQRLRTAIENRGVDFAATSSVLDQLKKAGAGPDILELIARVAPKPPPPPEPPPPPPPAPPKKGALDVECDPAECQISLNGKPRGTTAGGKLLIPDVPAGKYVVDFSKSGYLSGQQTATIEPDRRVAVSARLVPEERTRELLGAHMMVRMLDAMGGDQAFRKAERITATGTLTLSDPAGRPSEWMLIAHLTPPDSVFLDKLRNGKTSAWFALDAETPRASHKFEQIAEAAAIEHAARMLRRFQPYGLVGRIEKDKTRLLADHPRALNFEARVENDVYQITVGQDFLPLRIRHLPPGRPEAATNIVYSGYDSRKPIHYPTGIQIEGPGGRVTAFRFDSVSFDPTLTRK